MYSYLYGAVPISPPWLDATGHFNSIPNLLNDGQKWLSNLQTNCGQITPLLRLGKADQFLFGAFYYCSQLNLKIGDYQAWRRQLLTMPGEGFFYTYLTNFSDNLVTFDNLTIRHKQGTLRNIHEYYPYGLEYWRSGTKLYDRGDQFSEFHHREWELDGIEMNRFAARWYDPVA
jgi:hypothetical protein